MKFGIDASRNRSGGARAHIIGILNNFDEIFLENGIDQIHIWSFPELLAQLPNKNWLIKHAPDDLNKSLLHQLWWQFKKLPVEAKYQGIDILLNTDAGTVCRFQPSVTMSRDMLSYEKGEMERFGLSFQRIRLILLRYIQNFSLTNSTAAIFLTNYASDVIQKNSGPVKLFKIIPHGVSDNFRKLAHKRDFNISDEINCVYVSNVSFYKHQDSVALAISILRNKFNIKIRFIGGGEGRAQFNFLKEKNNLDPNGLFIEQISFLKHSEVSKYLEDSDLFIFASSCENMPNTLIEGMSSGLPIVCSNRGPMPEVLEDAGLYFDPENVQSIVVAIEEMILNKELRLQLKKKSLELSRKYSWTRCSYETFNFLIEICNNKIK